MSILFLDDDRKRWAAFHKKYPGAEWAKNSGRAIWLISNNKYKYIFLDGDLKDGDSGMKVVDIVTKPIVSENPIEYGPVDTKRIFVVHSTNILLAMEMLRALQDAGCRAMYIPFDYKTWIKP